ncbi:MAG: sterol desaturase family protein [Bacteroidota bacterium]|nr:sterol desaturase family protein [Bacteroidota bacterium]
MLYIVIAIGLFFIILERIIPDQKLPEAKGWWLRVCLINCFQIGIVLLGTYSWDQWFINQHIINLAEHFSPFASALISYFIITFIFYWWHRWRHEVNWLWLLCHQLHHSASRIETITSFYKHPVEIILDSILICIINNLLGIGIEGAAFVLLLTACAEYFYHMNIRTPHWIGYVFQRPEMHRIHHEKGKHFSNFSDLPVWDMLFGTFKNPKENVKACGFTPEREQQFGDILLFKNVNGSKAPSFSFSKIKNKLVGLFMISLGLLQTIGYCMKNDTIKGLGFMSGSSPLPIVFTSVKGVETFSLYYNLKLITENNDTIHIDLDPATYAQLKGPYNRRNIYGAAFGYGPVLPEKQRTAVLHYAFFNKENNILKDFGITEPLKSVSITIRSKTKNDNRSWNYLITK